MSDDYNTLRKQLTEEGFDWEKGVITLQADEGEEAIAYHASARNGEGLLKTLLDKDISTGFGRSKFPPFIAHDPKFIYIHVVYDGAEWIGKVARDPSFYADTNLPQFGGG